MKPSTSPAMRYRPSLREVLEPIPMTCLKCGSAGTIYPYPEKGTAFCPKCSPAWLKSFLEFASATKRAELLGQSA